MRFKYVLWKYTPVNSLTVPTWQSKDKFSRPIHIKCCKCCGETNGRQTRAQYPRGFNLIDSHLIEGRFHTSLISLKQTKLRPSWEVPRVQFTPHTAVHFDYIIMDGLLHSKRQLKQHPTSLLKSGTMCTQQKRDPLHLQLSVKRLVLWNARAWKHPPSVSRHTITQSSRRSCPVLQRLTLVSWRHAQSVSEREGLYQVPASENPVEILQFTVRNAPMIHLLHNWNWDQPTSVPLIMGSEENTQM